VASRCCRRLDLAPKIIESQKRSGGPHLSGKIASASGGNGSGALLADDPLWYKDAVIYQLHVKGFFDSADDGIGDFPGLTSKLDYLRDLGVNTLWLLPFYPSPMRDDGYDIADYHGISAQYGTRKDFVNFVREAHRRGLRVITELVVNHTSDQHPWFQAARRSAPGSAKRNFYVWSDSDKTFPETRIIFTDYETSNWAWDPVAGAYYWHRFFSHQPDLNHNNPQVVRAMVRVMRFWLDLGVDGLRLDAIPYLCVREGTNNENLPETHAVIREMRRVVEHHYRNRMFLAEANQWPEDVREYFGAGDECHVAYHFPLMPRIYMAVAQEDRFPIVEIMRQTPEIPDSCQWAIFLRNHDELTLEMVTDRERDYMYQMYAQDPRMRVNVGIRRRLAPLLSNDRDKIELLNSLLMSMPGSPIIYYGDELGMGDNIYLGDRNSVRTPMQWSPDRNAGFSRADPARLYLPPLMDSVYGYQAINVEAQTRSASSLLNWMKRLLAVRKAHQAFGRGSLEFLAPGNRKILAYLREYGGESLLCVANLGRSAQPVELDLNRFRGRVPIEMLGRSPFPPIGDLPYLLTLPGYGFYWFRLTDTGEIPAWHEEHLPPETSPTLVLFDGWRSFHAERVAPTLRSLANQAREHLEVQAMPQFIVNQRWFTAKGESITRVVLIEDTEWQDADGSWLLALFAVTTKPTATQRYFVPLSLVWESEGEDRLRDLRAAIIAKARQRAKEGIVCDALADGHFAQALVKSIGEQRVIRCTAGRIQLVATSAYRALVGEGIVEEDVHEPIAQGTNTAVAVGAQFFLKIYRQVHEGINPELEMGRFLTEVVHFEHSVPVAGAIDYRRDDGAVMTLGLLQRYLENQGDGWGYTLDYLERFLMDCQTAIGDLPPAPEDAHAAYLVMARRLGSRTGELHRALAVRTGDPAFDPEPISEQDMACWKARIRTEAAVAIETLKRGLNALPVRVQSVAGALLESWEPLVAHTLDSVPQRLSAVKTRYHGDLHLGQVLVVQNDFVIIDFEGEPARSFAERRVKQSALRDVAGMLRSYNYVAFAALYRLTAERPDDFGSLEPHARAFEALAAGAFMAGYRETIHDCPVMPADPPIAEHLLTLFMLEKAFYELSYEIHHRPNWVGVPVNGILALIDALSR
jgi:maltose alpha-D-glucosyltransferase/alpha-amylase